MSEGQLRFKNTRLEIDGNDGALNDESVERKFTLSRNPRDLIYMLLFVTFGLWILSRFLFKANLFGEFGSVSGPFLIIGGVCCIVTSSRDIRKVGALSGLFGSGLACFMFFTLHENNLVYILPRTIIVLALGVSILYLLLSFAQLCKTL